MDGDPNSQRWFSKIAKNIKIDSISEIAGIPSILKFNKIILKAEHLHKRL